MALLKSIILYVRDMDRSAEFYCRHFGYSVHTIPGDRITELVPADGGAHLLLHPAGKGQKLGQAAVKLVFTVENVQHFIEAARGQDLEFGPPYPADGYEFANSKDPDGNSIQISGRFHALFGR